MTADRIAVGVMARAPSDERGKTRLLSAVGTAGGRELRRALLLDTLDVVRHVDMGELVVLYSPATAEAEFASLTGQAIGLIPQRGGDLGDRQTHAFEDLFARGYAGALIVGSDLPTLPPSHLEDAIRALRSQPDPVVLGPSLDGGYYLIGLRQSHPELFQEIPWSTNDVFGATVAAATRAGLSVSRIPPWYDVDSADDLQRVAGPPAAGSLGAPRTRAWIRNRVLDGRSPT